MAKMRITQQTFDAAVKENMKEFEMEPEEALKDAVEQFESQDVDLSCIVKAIPAADDEEEQTHEVLQALDSLKRGKDSAAALTDMTSDLKTFTDQCNREFAQRYLAAQKEAYPIILYYCRRSYEEEEPDTLLEALSALAALTDGLPDLLDAEGRDFLLDVLNTYAEDVSLTRVVVRTIRHFCVKHEQNRQDLVKVGLLPLLTNAITRHSGSGKLVKEASAALRVMTFDDDIRVMFGHAHEHAKMIVLEHNGLKVLIQAAKAHLDDTSVLSEVCAALSCLSVRNEFCQDVCDLGGLKLIMTLLANSYEKVELVRQVLSAIRAIAGNDDVKDAVVNAGGVQLIVITMNRHTNNAAVCEQGCACLSVLALRKPENCQVIMENGGALAAVQAMKTHPNVVNVQKQACMLLRNLVSRMQHLCQPILDLGAEALITQALQKHQDCGDVGKATLRDLGCEVELRELWKGKHGGLTN
ncbi:armadillo repeat-containing protein 6-like [Gouania willdenowi]|uniref:Armadillo repeat-containing protein 6-like n=1 Tax=Gouania willdenowi TaxID=441366 RepID=A0A8C5GBX2_GOUWI|nr:armadillo repeat-containing protein 6-like [Gouania willdenowi]